VVRFPLILTPEKKPPKFRRRIPRVLCGLPYRERTLHDVFQRALAVTSTMDAERHIILAIAFAWVFEVPLPKFEYALRKYKRGATLKAAADELQASAGT
jgi:hypothetical protein